MKRINYLCIGSELLSGHTKDKNLAVLAEFANKNNFRVENCLVVNDDENEIKRALDYLKDCEFLIISGGLGPTKDDITKNVLAKKFNLKLEYNHQALEIIEKQFKEKSKEYVLSDYDYHRFPQGAQAIYNEKGYAPGIYLNEKIIALPGVPYEFKNMLYFLSNKFKSDQFTEEVNYRCFGVPEKKIFTNIAPKLWGKLEVLGEVSSLPYLCGVDIKISLIEKSKDALLEKKKKIQEIISASKINEYIWHRGHDSIEKFIVDYLKRENKLLAIAESCTGGLISSMITDIEGSSKVFGHGLVSYSNKIKEEKLKVPKQLIQKHNAVSKEVCLEMARNIKEISNSDYGLSTTGYAGLDDQNQPGGKIFIGVSNSEETKSYEFNFKGSREILKKRFALFALHCLRQNF